MHEYKEFAPYCGDTIGSKGQIREPANFGGHRWISIGSAPDGITVYRVVTLYDYVSPHPDLPLSYSAHWSLSDDHPFRYSHEGMIVTWRKEKFVLTDEHIVPAQPYIRVSGHYAPDPGFDPYAILPKRSPNSPWKNDLVFDASIQLSLFDSAVTA